MRVKIDKYASIVSLLSNSVLILKVEKVGLKGSC